MIPLCINQFGFPSSSCGARPMSNARARPQMPGFAKALIAVMFGILAGGALNYLLGDQGADTPAFAIYGGVLALVIYIVQARFRSWN